MSIDIQDVCSEKINRTKTITLALTEACNLNCIYCYETNKSKKQMTFDTAKKILEREFTNADISQEFYIEFFGGEPFLAFGLMQDIVKFVKTSYPTGKYHFFATTNGTLIHNEIQKWLIENIDCITVGLSLDGTKAMHDFNRSNSYDSIDLDFFKANYPRQGVKMTISAETLPSLCEGIVFIHNLGFQCHCNLAYGIDWSCKSSQTVLEEQLYKLIDYYLSHPNIKPCSMLDEPISYIGYEEINTTIPKWCGVSTHMSAYSVDGNHYPCQFFMPVSIGKENALKAKKIEFCSDIAVENLDEKCKTCVVQSICPTCYGSNYLSTGNIYSKDDNLCKLTKIILRARSYFMAKQYEAGNLKLTQLEEQALIRSILKIQNQLNI